MENLIIQSSVLETETGYVVTTRDARSNDIITSKAKTYSSMRRVQTSHINKIYNKHYSYDADISFSFRYSGKRFCNVEVYEKVA